jgi:dsDNA-binding SOS-regulon protein
MSHVTKKEADAYDRVLDAANCISHLLVKSGINIDEDDLEALSIFIADNARNVMQILRKVTKRDLLPRQKEIPWR